MTTPEVQELAGRLANSVQGRERIRSVTLEAGRGQTYSHGRPVLYGHGTYERGSVLAGQPLRRWLHQWETWAEARRDLAELRVHLADRKVKGLKIDDHGPEGGSTHVDVEVITGHLPDDTDY